MNKCKCEKCASNEYLIINAKKVRHPEHGGVELELRQCRECHYRYKVEIHSEGIEGYC